MNKQTKLIGLLALDSSLCRWFAGANCFCICGDGVCMKEEVLKDISTVSQWIFTLRFCSLTQALCSALLYFQAF